MTQNFQVAFASMATRLFTTDDKLRAKSYGYLEVEFDGTGWRASLYRASSSVPEALSRDLYRWDTSGWRRVGEASEKYANPPVRIRGHRTQVGTFLVWSEEPLTDAIKERLRELLRILPSDTE